MNSLHCALFKCAQACWARVGNLQVEVFLYSNRVSSREGYNKTHPLTHDVHASEEHDKEDRNVFQLNHPWAGWMFLVCFFNIDKSERKIHVRCVRQQLVSVCELMAEVRRRSHNKSEAVRCSNAMLRNETPPQNVVDWLLFKRFHSTASESKINKHFSGSIESCLPLLQFPVSLRRIKSRSIVAYNWWWFIGVFMLRVVRAHYKQIYGTAKRFFAGVIKIWFRSGAEKIHAELQLPLIKNSISTITNSQH